MALHDHMPGDGRGLDRVEIANQHIDPEPEVLGGVVATVGGHHQVGGGELIGDSDIGEVTTGEDQDGVHNDKIVLRALSRVSTNRQVEVETLARAWILGKPVSRR